MGNNMWDISFNMEYAELLRIPSGNLLHSKLENHHAIHGKIHELK